MGMPGAPDRDEHLSPGARALLGLLLPAGDAALAERVRGMSPQVWDQTLALALRHGVAARLHLALQSGGALAAIPHPVRARLEDERRATAFDNLRNYGEFRRIARALREREIPVIALKGLHLAELVYRDISLRPMSDMDILVPVSQVKPAVATLLTLDYELDNGSSDRHDVGLTHRRLGILVEIHWTLAEPDEPYTPPIEAIWRSAEPARLGDAAAQIMSPEFLLLHVCAHLAYHHLFFIGLGALCDIGAIVRAYPAIDWAVLVDHSRRYGASRGVAAALRLAREHLAAAVPSDVLTALGADSLDPGMLDEAMAQVLTCFDIPDALRFAPNLMAFAGTRGTAGNLAALWRRIFVPRAELASIYGVPESSARLTLYYAIRLSDLLRKYAASAWALNVSDPQLAATVAAIVARHARLARWIDNR